MLPNKVNKKLGTSSASADIYERYGILTSVDSDKPVQPPFKLRNSK